MGDDTQKQSSGKPNKFDEQNKHSGERKGAEAPIQTDKANAPAAETKFTEPTKKP